MKTIARWILCIPAAALAATLTSLVIGYLTPLTMGRFDADPDRVFMAFAQGVGMGVTFVGVGSAVAPSRQGWVPYGLAGLTALLLGTVLLPAIHTSRWNDLLSFGLLVSAAFVTAWRLQPSTTTANPPAQTMDGETPQASPNPAGDGSPAAADRPNPPHR